jgi:hypothetical protein
LYWILRSYVQAGGDLIHNGAPWFPNQYNSFQPYYRQWVRYIFDIDAVIDGRKRKRFKLDKVGITTSGVRASVHYRNMPKRNVPNIPDPDDESLAQSIAYLSLNHHGDDVIEAGNDLQQGNAVVNIGIDNEDDVNDHVMDNIVNDVDVDDPIVAGFVNDDENNVAGGEPMLDHFVNVGVDPVMRLNLTGMSHYFFQFLHFDIVYWKNIIK